MLLLASLIVLLLVLLNGVFAMTELAVVSSKRQRLQARADKGDRGARAALALADQPTRFLSAVQVGITLIGILAGAFGQATIATELDAIFERSPLLRPYSEAISTGVVVVVLTYLSLILGELVPKRLALAAPEPLASAMARPITLLARILHPFVTLLTASTAAVLRLLRVRERDGTAVTQEELESTLAEGTSAGLIEPEEQQMIGEVLRLGDRPVRVAMTPRLDVYWVSLADEESVLRREIRDCPYARMVVTERDDVDAPVGVVHKKDLLDALLDGDALDLRPLIQTPLFIPETTSVLRILALLKQTPVHMAFVVDEYGAFQGVVTPTDVLEMIAGDFPESHDDSSPMILRREDGSYLVDGRADIDDLRELLQEDFHLDAAYHTAAGLVLDRLGRVPSEGDVLTLGRHRIEVVDMDEHRIDKLLISQAPREPRA